MGLQIWLPLNKDLKNLGAAHTTISSSGATLSGNCHKFTASTSLGYNPNVNTGSISFGGWFKFNKSEIATVVENYTYTSSRTYPTGNLLGNDSYGGVGLIWNGNNMYSSSGVFNTMTVFSTMRSSTTNKSTGSYSIQFDKWTHIFLVFNNNTRLLQTYINGNLHASVSVPAATDFTTNVLRLNYNAVYGGNGPAFSIPYYSYDVRVYDKALSKKEILQLSKGLIFHYKCNDIQEYENNTLNDFSGFDNHATITGELSEDTLQNSGRYNKCIFFNGSSAACIGNLSTLLPDGNFTFNCWFKVPSLGSKAWATILGGPSGFELETRIRSTSYAYIHPYSWGGGSTDTPNSYSIAYDLNTWNMLTMVRTTSNTKFYLNGELKVTGLAGSIPSGNYYIGSWRDASSQNYYGYTSDTRIYATALSDSDVANLYKDSMIVDNLQNIECYEIVEDDTTNEFNILPNGQIISKTYAETLLSCYDNTAYIEPDGSVWIKIFHHNNHTKVYKNVNAWFNVSLCNQVNSWEFMVKQKLTSSASEVKYRWIQNVNPMTATYEQVALANITKITTSGYTSFTGNYAGIYRMSNSSGDNSKVFMVQNNGTQGNWYGATGCWTAYNGGVPSYNGSVCTSGYMDLYIRIDNVQYINSNITSSQTQVRLSKDGVTAAEFMEI